MTLRRLVSVLLLLLLPLAAGMARPVDAPARLHPSAALDDCACCDHEGLPASQLCAAACQPASLPEAATIFSRPLPAAWPTAAMNRLDDRPQDLSTPPPRRS
jgi:hypothetical protein